jgi:hypothetical protein
VAASISPGVANAIGPGNAVYAGGADTLRGNDAAGSRSSSSPSAIWLERPSSLVPSRVRCRSPHFGQ